MVNTKFSLHIINFNVTSANWFNTKGQNKVHRHTFFVNKIAFYCSINFYWSLFSWRFQGLLINWFPYRNKLGKNAHQSRVCATVVSHKLGITVLPSHIRTRNLAPRLSIAYAGGISSAVSYQLERHYTYSPPLLPYPQPTSNSITASPLLPPPSFQSSNLSPCCN